MVAKKAVLQGLVMNLETADGLKKLETESIFRSLPLFSFCYKSGE